MDRPAPDRNSLQAAHRWLRLTMPFELAIENRAMLIALANVARLHAAKLNGSTTYPDEVRTEVRPGRRRGRMQQPAAHDLKKLQANDLD